MRRVRAVPPQGRRDRKLEAAVDGESVKDTIRTPDAPLLGPSILVAVAPGAVGLKQAGVRRCSP